MSGPLADWQSIVLGDKWLTADCSHSQSADLFSQVYAPVLSGHLEYSIDFCTYTSFNQYEILCHYWIFHLRKPHFRLELSKVISEHTRKNRNSTILSFEIFFTYNLTENKSVFEMAWAFTSWRFTLHNCHSAESSKCKYYELCCSAWESSFKVLGSDENSKKMNRVSEMFLQTFTERVRLILRTVWFIPLFRYIKNGRKFNLHCKINGWICRAYHAFQVCDTGTQTKTNFSLELECKAYSIQKLEKPLTSGFQTLEL